MALKQTTAPAALPVSPAEAKLHLRVDGADDDTLITAMLWAACQAAEQLTGRALMPQAWQLACDQFPATLVLTRVPVVSVNSIIYVDSAGADITLPNTEYSLDNACEFGFASVVPAYGKSWPSARVQPNSVRVIYQAGYANADAVPESIKAWIKLQVGAMYENRELEGAVQTYALGFADRLLDRYKVWGL